MWLFFQNDNIIHIPSLKRAEKRTERERPFSHDLLTPTRRENQVNQPQNISFITPKQECSTLLKTMGEEVEIKANVPV